MVATRLAFGQHLLHLARNKRESCFLLIISSILLTELLELAKLKLIFAKLINPEMSSILITLE